MDENEIATKIIDHAFALHRTVGPGLLESAYQAAFTYELKAGGLEVSSQVSQPFQYKEVQLDVGYRLDLLVGEKVIVEIKAVEYLMPVHFAQLLTYLRLSNKRLGLLINFNEKWLKEGIHRVVNRL